MLFTDSVKKKKYLNFIRFNATLGWYLLTWLNLFQIKATMEKISKVSTNKIQQWEDLVIYFGYIVYKETPEANINFDLGTHLNLSLLLVCLFLNDGIILIL